MTYHFFKSGERLHAYDLSDHGQRMGALALMAPALHAEYVAKTEALKAWEVAKKNYEQELSKIQDRSAHPRNEFDSDDESLEAELDYIDDEIANLQDPGPQPPTPTEVSKDYVLANLGQGWELLDAPPAPPITDVRKSAKADIEGAFSAALSPYMPRLEGYKLREAQAVAYKAAEYSGDVPSQVAAFQVASGMTPQAATDTILAQAAAFRGALEALELRRMRKFEVDAMTDAAAIQAKAAQICGEIKAIAAML
jgi:hypothetical protein